MAISFANATGNLFNRIGRLGKVIAELRTYQNNQYTNTTSQSIGVVGQYNAEPDIQAIMGSSYIGLLDAAGGNVAGTLQTLAVLTANRVVFRDAPRLNQTLTSDSTVASLQEIIRQMNQQGATVLAQTIAATPTAFQGTGNGVLNLSTRRSSDGRVLENSFAETMNVICSQDSYTGGATAGQESFNVTGTGSEGNVFAFDWPLGSNASIQIQMIDGGSSQSGGNLLNNSSFDAFTSNLPDNWEIIKGVAGTDILEATGAGYDSTSALEFIGDGVTLVGIRQAFNSSDGNTTQIQPATQYGACIFIRRGGLASVGGTLQLALVNEGNVPLVDMAGNNCQLQITLANLTTEWTAYVISYRTPIILADPIYFQLQCVSPPDAGVEIYMDRISLGLMTQIYTGGPWISGHSGNSNFLTNDQAQVVVTNSRGAAGTLNTFQTLVARLIPQMGQNELLLPSSASPTIPDSLITS